MPAVSVIMPAFNAARYLHVAVDSVLRQTIADLELLIVDDGSSDDTVAIARRYARRDSRVRVLTQPNAGPGPARNTAFSAAAAPIFSFLDSDDEWQERFLESQLAFLARRPDVDVAIGNAWYRGGPRDGRPCRPVRAAGRPILLPEILADEEVIFIMSTFRRRAVEAAGGFDPAIFTNEEYEMWIRAALAGVTFARNPQPLGWYSVRADSLSANEMRMLSGILRVLDKVRPALPPRSPERAILDRQTARFEAELAAASARASLERGDGRTAAQQLTTLAARNGSWAAAAAAGLLTHAPRAALAAYRLRTRLRGAA